MVSEEDRYYHRLVFRWTSLVILTLFSVIIFGMWGCPRYNVWQQGLAGQAELRRAEQNRQIAVQEALAHFESAKYEAQAEVQRAYGVDSANRIISGGLKGNWEYLHYLWVNTLKQHPGAIIYIPTEANIPIMEAGRYEALNHLNSSSE